MDVISRGYHMQIRFYYLSEFRYSQCYSKSKICVAAVQNSTCTFVCMTCEGPTLRYEITAKVLWPIMCQSFDVRNDVITRTCHNDKQKDNVSAEYHFRHRRVELTKVGQAHPFGRPTPMHMDSGRPTRSIKREASSLFPRFDLLAR
jgi:hypothetical protein